MPRRPSIAVRTVDDQAKLDTNKLVRFPARAKVKNPAAVALGKLGGSKGGNARAAKLSAEERKTIAQQAAKARWAKERVHNEMEGSLRPSSKT